MRGIGFPWAEMSVPLPRTHILVRTPGMDLAGLLILTSEDAAPAEE